MLWIVGALTIGSIVNYAAFRELTNDLGAATVLRTLRASVALCLGVVSTTIIGQNSFFDHHSHTLMAWPILAWFVAALFISYQVVSRQTFACSEKLSVLNLYSGLISLLVISLTITHLIANGGNLLETLGSFRFWLSCLFTVAIITFAFYACSFVSLLLNRPSMLNYRYFTRPIMLTVCLLLTQVVGGLLYPELNRYAELQDTQVTVSREQLLLTLAVFTCFISTLLLGSNFYARYLGNELKDVLDLLHSNSSTHTFWQAFMAFMAISLLLISVMFWLQWNSALSQKNSVTAVSMRNAINAVHDELETLVNDLNSVKQLFHLNTAALKANPSYLSTFQHFFEGYSLSADHYRYISVLDENGEEIARIDHQGEIPSFTYGVNEQTINYSYEHMLGQTLRKGDFFISHVSLARINSDLVTPLQPVLKLGKAIFSPNDNYSGLLLFTYRFDTIQNILKRFFPDNSDVYLLNESNRVLINLASSDTWEHLKSVTQYQFIDLDRNTLHPDTISSENRQTYIFNTGIFPANLGKIEKPNIPQWSLAVKTPYPELTMSDGKTAIVLLLLGVSLLLAKLVGNSVVNNLSNKKRIAELLNEVGYQKQALDEHAIVSITDVHGIINYVNHKFTEISGYSEDELLGQNHRILKSDEHSPEFFRKLWRTVAKGEVWTGEIKNHRKNGSFYWVNATILPIKGTSGKVERYIAVRTDITESKVIADILENALKEAHLAAETKNRFIANISHEIRTPMNAIIGLTEACITSPDKKNQQDLIRKVNSSANNLLRIINDILDFSKMEAGKVEVENIPFSLERVLEEYAYIHYNTAKAKQVRLLTGIDSNVPGYLIGDPLRIGQILSNLVSNAVKFTSAGEVIVYVKKRSQKGDFVELEFSVHDTGTGMTQEQLDRLFSPFTQADISTTRKYGGTGLGLSICKSLVGLMGGDIKAESKPDEGTTFRFSISLKVDQDESHFLPKKVISTLQKRRALLIDYSCANRQNYIRYTNAFNMQLDFAANDDQVAEHLASTKRYDHILVDNQTIGARLQLLLETASHNASCQTLKSTVVMDYGIDLGDIQRWPGPVVTLTPPMTQSSLLESLLSRQEDVHVSEAAAEPEVSFQDLAILVAEDNDVNQLVLSEIFKHWGIQYQIVENGREAIKAVQKGSFDLVLMDIQMPVMDGYEACKGIRALGGSFTELPIIAVTANTATQDIQRALQAGMNDHIAKPINRQRLKSVIEQQIQRAPTLGSDQLSSTTNTTDNLQQTIINALPNIKVNNAIRRLGIEIDFYARILRSFKDSSENYLQEASTALEASDSATLGQIVHTIKGMAANIGATTIYEKSKQLEEDAKLSKFDSALFESMAQEVRDTCHAISLLCQQNAPSPEQNPVSKQHSLTKDHCLPLLELIDQYDTKANNLILELLSAQKETNIHIELEKIAAQLDNYDYENAAQTLRDLMESLS